MPRWLVWTLVLVALGALLIWWGLLVPDRVPVKVVEVGRGTVESTVTNTKAGTVRARLRARLAPEMGGKIARIAHREGDRVSRGDVLIELDGATQRAELELARQTLLAAQASHREACIRRDRTRRSLERQRELAEKHVVSADLLDELQSSSDAATAACRGAAAEVERVRAQIGVIEVALQKLLIRAPFDGVVAEVQGEVGEWVTPSPPLLVAPAAVDIIDLSSLYVSAPMDEVDAASIRVGQQARVTVDSYPDRDFEGEVIRVAPYVLDIEAQNRTIEIEVELRDEKIASTLLPGTSADVEVIRELRDDVLRIPTPTLLQDDHVLVAQDGRLEERAIDIGLRNWNWAEVAGGLEAGQQVVLSLDRAEVKDGARAEVEVTEYRP
jgi:HlyD family secretion protein